MGPAREVPKAVAPQGRRQAKKSADWEQVPGAGAARPVLVEPAEQTLGRLIQLQLLAAGSGLEQTTGSKEWERLRAGISPKYLHAIDHLMAHGRTAVAILSETGACGGCHLKLPGALALHIQHALNQIHFCPHCGCILYVAAATPFAPEPPPGRAVVDVLVSTPPT